MRDVELTSAATKLQQLLFNAQKDYLKGLLTIGLPKWGQKLAFKRRCKDLANYYSNYLITEDDNWKLITFLEYTICKRIKQMINSSVCLIYSVHITGSR